MRWKYHGARVVERIACACLCREGAHCRCCEDAMPIVRMRVVRALRCKVRCRSL